MQVVPNDFIREYEQAYLLELRAGLVESTELALSSRLYAYQDKLPPEVLMYLKGLPSCEQPRSLDDVHEALRKWADIQRTGQSHKRNLSAATSATDRVGMGVAPHVRSGP